MGLDLQSLKTYKKKTYKKSHLPLEKAYNLEWSKMRAMAYGLYTQHQNCINQTKAKQSHGRSR